MEIVQLLNRMVKERHFNVHPDVLTCLLHLRLKNELHLRASDTKSDKEKVESTKAHSKGRSAARRAKGKPTDQPHLSKNAKKALKEKKEIEKELREAEAEVDKEERAKTVRDSKYSMYRRTNFREAAYGNSKTCICAVFPNHQKPQSDASTACCVKGYLEICTSRQR